MITHAMALCIASASAKYHVPESSIRHEIAVTRQSNMGIGVMGLPSVWAPVLDQDGFGNIQAPCQNIMAGTFILALEAKRHSSVNPILQAAAVASKEYNVPMSEIEKVLEAPKAPGLIGPMGVPQAWIPILQNAGFSPMLVRSNPEVGVFAGVWALAVERMGQSISIKPSPSPMPPTWFLAIAGKYAAQYHVPLALVTAVAAQESGFRPGEVSSAGAVGVMQLMPETAQGLHVADVWNARQNIRGGVSYLAILIHDLNGNIPLVLAGYNAGEHAVAQYGYNIPPFAQTEAYVPEVLSRYKFYDAEMKKNLS